MTHDNRNWQRRWAVDFESQTATHVDGWVFKFERGQEDGQVFFDGRLIAQPEVNSAVTVYEVSLSLIA